MDTDLGKKIQHRLHNCRDLADFLEEVGEADGEWNSWQCQIIEQMCKANNGTAYLGKINLRTDEDVAIPIWDYNADKNEPPLYTFGADFVLPHWDTQLADMIVARHQSEYSGTQKDYVLVTAIIERVKELGGHLLNWS